MMQHVNTIGQVLSKNFLYNKIWVNGWVKAARKQKRNTFFDLEDGVSSRMLQVVSDSDNVPADLKFHSAVSVFGCLEPSNHPAQEYEFKATQIKIINSCNLSYPFGPRKRYSEDFVRQFPELRAKNKYFSSLLRIRNALSHALHHQLQLSDFIQIHTPVLTSNDCEGAGEVFVVRPFSLQTCRNMNKNSSELSDEEAYFDKYIYLTVSSQLHLEAMANGLARVYSFGPVFRAEMGRSRRHLSEFFMLEVEVAFVDEIDFLRNMIENLIKASLNSVLSSCGDDIERYRKYCSGLTLHNSNFVERLLSSRFEVMSYDNAMNILENQNTINFNTPVLRGKNFGKEHELFLTHHCGDVPLFIIDWPVNLKPFYVLRGPKYAKALDLLFPHVGELCGGSIREFNVDHLRHRTNHIDGSKLEWYFNLRLYGGAPTAGFGLGFERLVQFLLGIPNIKDSLPFPRSPHDCRL